MVISHKSGVHLSHLHYGPGRKLPEPDVYIRLPQYISACLRALAGSTPLCLQPNCLQNEARTS